MAKAVFLLAMALAIALFICLGVWQIERRTWKLELIDRVESRVHALPVPAPGPEAWPGIARSIDEYRQVELRGRYLNDQETFVKAVTDLGEGYWVVTPFRSDQGFTVLINRGFVPPDRVLPESRVSGQVDGETGVTGLLRLTEPGGGFLRANDTNADRWFSRDVDAIAQSRGLTSTAPYFVDADSIGQSWPRGGMTVLHFRNSHLFYAFTWFGLAALFSALLPKVWKYG